MTPETRKKVQDNIKQAADRLEEMRKDISDAKMAGIDVSFLEQQYNEQRQRVNKMRTVYGG